MATVVAQQREVGVGAEVRAGVGLLDDVRQHRPEVLGERIVEVHARDGLHHPPVAQAEAPAVNGLHRADVRAAVLGDRDALVALDGAGHAGRPQQLVADVAVDELVQVAEVLGQLPGLGERRRDQLDQRLGVVGGQVLVAERRAQDPGVGGLGDAALGGDPEGLLLDPLEAALQGGGGAAVDQGPQAAFVGAVEGHGEAENFVVVVSSWPAARVTDGPEGSPHREIRGEATNGLFDVGRLYTFLANPATSQVPRGFSAF